MAGDLGVLLLNFSTCMGVDRVVKHSLSGPVLFSCKRIAQLPPYDQLPMRVLITLYVPCVGFKYIKNVKCLLKSIFINVQTLRF